MPRQPSSHLECAPSERPSVVSPYGFVITPPTIQSEVGSTPRLENLSRKRGARESVWRGRFKGQNDMKADGHSSRWPEGIVAVAAVGQCAAALLQVHRPTSVPFALSFVTWLVLPTILVVGGLFILKRTYYVELRRRAGSKILAHRHPAIGYVIALSQLAKRATLRALYRPNVFFFGVAFVASTFLFVLIYSPHRQLPQPFPMFWALVFGALVFVIFSLQVLAIGCFEYIRDRSREQDFRTEIIGIVCSWRGHEDRFVVHTEEIVLSEPGLIRVMGINCSEVYDVERERRETGSTDLLEPMISRAWAAESTKPFRMLVANPNTAWAEDRAKWLGIDYIYDYALPFIRLLLLMEAENKGLKRLTIHVYSGPPSYRMILSARRGVVQKYVPNRMGSTLAPLAVFRTLRTHDIEDVRAQPPSADGVDDLGSRLDGLVEGNTEYVTLYGNYSDKFDKLWKELPLIDWLDQWPEGALHEFARRCGVSRERRKEAAGNAGLMVDAIVQHIAPVLASEVAAIRGASGPS